MFIVVSVDYFLFAISQSFEYSSPTLVFVCVLLLLWPAYRFEQLGAVTATLVTCMIAIRFTVLGMGPFYSDVVNVSLIHLQLFMAISAFTVLLLAAAIRERRRVESDLVTQTNELARSNADLEQFAYAASHDLQEPLRMVSSYCQLLEKRYAPQFSMEALGYLNFAIDGAKRMQQLIEDLLKYSRVTRTIEPDMPFDSQNALDLALKNLQGQIKEKKALIEVSSLPVLTGSYTKITQVFQNLVGNALKYNDKNPPVIKISTYRDSHLGWVFIIEDNGIGIAPEFHDNIFLIFHRLHSRDEFSGNGLGLALCKRIIEQHGGDIWLESTPEKGSSFFFNIPDPKQ
jgi:light-regulated signal transduction histidine kinase (bacteriophytochrome)